MGINRRFGFGNIAERIIRIGLLFVLALTGIIICVALFDKNPEQEAYIGNFRADSFNYKWRYEGSAETDYITLPVAVDKKYGDEVVIVNTLPRYLGNGMTLLVRSSMDDVYVYVDGKLRSQYSSDSYEHVSYYIPSAYLAVNLYTADAGKEIKIQYKFKTKRIIRAMTIGYGNNSWFKVLKDGLGVNLIAVIVFVLGVFVFIGSLFWQNSYRVGATKNLGLLMINVSLWVLSESSLRQFIFRRPSFSQYFAYMLAELIGALACLYIDEVQHRQYHKRYMVMEGIVLLQIIINIFLEIGGILEFYDTLVISQFWSSLCGLLAFINTITDIRTKRVKNYHITSIGIICFIVLSLAEIIGFYFNEFHVFGIYISIALLILMMTTIIQTIYDEIKAIKQREKNRITMIINAIETIASAIDARDEYTGGHSERVGLYASRLAREIAAEYDLTEEDILRIHYIGLVHDIGKIGVADNVLNKPGKLSDEEFSLMKKHTQIGYEIMSSLGDTTEGLLDGIRYHHERFDGKGYPDGLAGTDIPLVARILAIADSYDAMTSNRVYRNRLSEEQVRSEFKKCAGKQYDPYMAEVFERLIDAGEIGIEQMTFEATYKTDMVLNSILLENKLQEDLLTENEEVVNPSHVRMLCYIIKLMEKKGMGFRLLFVDNGSDIESLGNSVKKRINNKDVYIQYTKTQYIVALYNIDQQKMDKFANEIKLECPNVEIQRLS